MISSPEPRRWWYRATAWIPPQLTKRYFAAEDELRSWLREYTTLAAVASIEYWDGERWAELICAACRADDGEHAYNCPAR